MGSDGHIAGILPRSPALQATGLVTAYETPTYQRITLTFPAIRRNNIVYLFVFGDEKKAALESLKARSASLADQPAQILHELPEVYVCNNQIGD
jgi:6-phosphogluconolactonase/glucosamine-6-phosphate isomerase/deaminase